MKPLEFLARFYTLDPRWLYLAVSITLLIPLIVNIPIPSTEASRGTRGLHDLIGSCPSNRVVLIESSWDQGAKPECMSVLSCVAEDLCRRHVRFIVFSTALYAPPFAEEVLQPITRKAGYVYGQDWVNLGFIQPPAGNMGMLVDSMLRDLHSSRPTDINGTPLDKLELMGRVKGAADIHFVYSVQYCPPLDWLSFGKGQHGVPVAFGSAAMMAPYYHVYLDSGQLSGLLAGNRSACEYEGLTASPGMASRVMMSFAFGHCFIIVAALLGNLGYLAVVRLGRRA